MQNTFSTITDYYTLCVATDFEPKIMELFNYDACVIIKKPIEFMKRLNNKSRNVLKCFDMYSNPIAYYDNHCPQPNEYIDPIMSKSFTYAFFPSVITIGSL